MFKSQYKYNSLSKTILSKIERLIIVRILELWMDYGGIFCHLFFFLCQAHMKNNLEKPLMCTNYMAFKTQ